jgi:hypothetical protein
MRTASHVGLSVLVAAMASLALVTSAAVASSGSFSSAIANPAWTQGSIAGSVTWDQCGSGLCDWTPVVVVDPILEPCSSPLESQYNARTIWNAGGQSANGTISFSVPTTPILNGVYGQKACLVVVGKNMVRDQVCEIQYETIRQFDEENHFPPPTKTLAESCPPIEHIFTTTLVSRNFAVEAPIVVPPLAAPPSAPQIVAPPPPAASPLAVTGISKPLTRQQKLANALRACRRKHSSKRRRACQSKARKLFGPTRNR